MAATKRKSPSKETPVEAPAPQDQAYIRIPVPSFAGGLQGVNPLMILLLVGFGAIIIFLFLKINSLEKSLSNAPATNAPEAFVRYAGKLGLNEKDFSSCLDSGKYTQKVQDDMQEGNRVGVTGTPATFVNGTLVVGAQPYETFKALIEQELAKSQLPNNSPFATIISKLVPQAFAQVIDPALQGAPLPTPTPIVRTDIKMGSLPILGKKEAKVTLVEFSDFQCPYCEQFFTSSLSQIKKEYIDTGKVKLNYRHYPLSFHQNAQKAAEASECANDQGKFWAYHDLLFQNQKAWENLPQAEMTTTTTQ